MARRKNFKKNKTFQIIIGGLLIAIIFGTIGFNLSTKKELSSDFYTSSSSSQLESYEQHINSLQDDKLKLLLQIETYENQIELLQEEMSSYTPEFPSERVHYIVNGINTNCINNWCTGQYKDVDMCNGCVTNWLEKFNIY